MNTTTNLKTSLNHFTVILCSTLSARLHSQYFYSLSLCLILIKQALVIVLRKVRSENLKFRTDLLDQVMDVCSLTLLQVNTLRRKLLKNLKIKNQSSSPSQCRWHRSLHGFQKLLFICNRAAKLCNLWLQSTQNNECVQAFEHSNLNWLSMCWLGLIGFQEDCLF